ncbi:MAG: hypothetical protein M3071_14355 [Actinomycetota bacterium]|nr:hypothetical protein [Actinomycetota bacterium]
MTSRPAIRRLTAAALALAGGAGAAAALAIPESAPAAPAAVIQLNHACYQTAQKAALRGKGFDPTSHWTARLDGAAFGNGTTDSAGDIAATFGVPSHLRKGSTGEDSYKLIVREGNHSASAQFLVSRLNASFRPQSGDLTTLKVRFQLLGWGAGGSLYLHYVNPKGVSRLDRKLGASGGACGHLSTAPLKLFPFTPKRGRWLLQFDKNATYRAGSVPRVVVPYKIS